MGRVNLFCVVILPFLFPLSPTELRCSGPDWFEFGDFCYKPFGDKKTWHDAQSSCRALGAELVSILSMTEQSWLEGYLYMATSDIWIGLNDLFYAGLFSWSDQHITTFTYWAPGEPNNHDGNLKTLTGEKLNTYVCKMPKAHYPPPSVQPTVYGCPQVRQTSTCHISLPFQV
uniref:C-type lectin domain-containing protein n=1 Tax=Pundamilia nyererei TaxID=303518 RepID=A0A3B4FGI6_9CICH